MLTSTRTITLTSTRTITLTSTRTITLTPGPGYVFDTGDFLAFAREVTANANSVQVRLSLDEHGDPDGLEAIVEEGTHEQP